MAAEPAAARVEHTLFVVVHSRPLSLAAGAAGMAARINRVAGARWPACCGLPSDGWAASGDGCLVVG